MIQSIIRILEIAAALGTLASAGYSLLCLWSAAKFVHDIKAAANRVPSTPFLPPVSILKPLKGVDPGMYESLRSHCLQDYPEYEIIFGVSEADDPAIALVERLRAEFPERTIRLVQCLNILGPNVKVSNLAQMLPQASNEYLIVNDGDIRVEPDYLRRVVAPLQSNAIGMSTCLYRGVPGASLGSQLEALGISADFCPGVLTARFLEGGIRFGLGSTLAFRRRDLQSVGGFESLLDYLADDYQLGNRLAASGLKVDIATTIVDTHLPSYSFGGFLRHQLRWARTVRDSRPWGYVGLCITFGLVWAALAVILSTGAAWAWTLFAVTIVLRLGAVAFVGGSVLRDRRVFGQLWLIPLRDVLGLGIWLASFVGHTVSWRGETFTLNHGRLVRNISKETLRN